MKKYKIGITFGVFDLLHEGHLRLLKRASERCELLIVAVSADGYVRDTKEIRPAMPTTARKACVKALPFVDRVITQGHSFTKQDAIKRYKPDVIFVGDDWTPATFGGEGLGVPVEYLERTKGVSSSKLREIIEGKL